jgi:trk system potassium uptake protein TrkH
MHWKTITRLFGTLLLLYSLSFLPSAGVSLLFDDGQWPVFLVSFMITAAAGLLLRWPARSQDLAALSIRDGFLVVALFWLVLGMTGSLPFLFGLHMNFTDAIFESVSGFTTTGATVIPSVELLPHSILYHRQQIQWIGGMGVIVLAVAVLPLLGMGGMQLYKAESSNIAQYEKLTPRIAQTARALWFVYFLLTLFCALGYWAAGMTLFDAVGHAFSTVATGGFSTHDASLGFYDSVLIESVAIVFMMAGGVNFAIHFMALRKQTSKPYIAVPEVRAFFQIFAAGVVLVTVGLFLADAYSGLESTLRHGVFQVASILTSTGFTTAVFSDWPGYVPLVLVTLSFIGGCVGSTAGGIKVVRVLLLKRIAVRELFHLAHPRAISTISLGKDDVPEHVLNTVKGFFILYLLTVLTLSTAMMGAGLDLESAFGAVLSTVNLLGPGMGEVATSFASVNTGVKWLAIFGMLVGRLEVFTLLILFLPSFWRH